jgi:glycerate 2-kinase
MRVVICPDKFAGTMSANEAAEAIAAGWRRVRAGDSAVLRPLADGGPGFLDVLGTAHPEGKRFPVSTTDPLGRPATGSVLVVGETAYVETAQATGLHHLSPGERDPRVTRSSGLLPLLRFALDQGVRRVVLGLGGSGTNDAGDDVLSSLSAADFAGIELVGATDVDNPLVGPRGASRVFGPQKGASPAIVEDLEAAMVQRAARFGRQIASAPGAGAAGGLGAMILALGGRLTSGIDLVRAAVELDAELAGAGLVITGEGSFDEQSLHGKVIDGVAGAARSRGVRCAVLAGRITVSAPLWEAAGVTTALSLVETYGAERALNAAGPALTDLAAALAASAIADQ